VSTTYFETDTNSDVNKNTVDAPAVSPTLSQSAPGAASQTITLPGSGTGVQHWFIAASDDPGADGTDGTHTLGFNVTTANMNVSGLVVRAHRLNSAGTSQATASFAGFATTALQSTGVKSGTTSTSLGTWASGDRLGIQLQMNNGSMSAQSVVFEVGADTTDEADVAPWTIGGAPAPTVKTLAVLGVG
jgi:hypothetical protein